MNVDQALLLLSDELAPVTGEWIIIGTASLYLLGYPVTPNDIDILADGVAAKQIERVLTRYRVDSPVKPDNKFRSIFSAYTLDSFKVELMGNLEVNTESIWALLRDVILKPQTILFKSRPFIVPSKDDQLQIYKLFNRDKDAQVLKMLKC